MILMNSAGHGLYSCVGRLHLWSKSFALLLEQGGMPKANISPMTLCWLVFQLMMHEDLSHPNKEA